MASTVVPLPADTWTKVLTNATYYGQVHILDVEPDQIPSKYLIALVDTGTDAPASDFEGGVEFEYSFSPSNAVASDYYVKPVGSSGKVVVLT